MIDHLTEEYDDIRYDLMGEFCPYVIYSGETKDSMYPFTISTNKDEAIRIAETISTFPVPTPARLTIEVRYLPDKNDINNTEVIWSKAIEPSHRFEDHKF